MLVPAIAPALARAGRIDLPSTLRSTATGSHPRPRTTIRSPCRTDAGARLNSGGLRSGCRFSAAGSLVRTGLRTVFPFFMGALLVGIVISGVYAFQAPLREQKP